MAPSKAELNSGGFAVYGGTHGVGLLIAEQLAKTGLAVTIVGRTSPTHGIKTISNMQIDFSTQSGFIKNRDFLLQNGNIKNFVFNIGGSFGVQEDSPKIDDFQILTNLNIGYITDTINFLEHSNRLTGSLLVFILSNAVTTGRGNLPYRMLKIALDEYAKALEVAYTHSFVEILRFYPPLILYPTRFMAKRFLAIESDSQRRRFIRDELAGFKPVYPEDLANEIVLSIIKKLVMTNKNDSLEARLAE